MSKPFPKRLELQDLVKEFQAKLGGDWDKYHESLSLFLVGKLSRAELVSQITPILKGGLVKYHNKLLLLNFVSSLKNGPLDYQNELALFWNKKANKGKTVRSSQYEKFKQNIMGLPLRERRRIKNITRDSGKKGKLSASITLTRHALLPKIPMIQDKEQQKLQVNNLVQWQQDVVNGINTPLSTQTYEIPDYEDLSRHVLMTMREYGLTGGASIPALEMIILGLETHLRNIVESAIDVARYRKHKYSANDIVSAIGIDPDGPKETTPETPMPQVTLHIEDLFNTLEMYPHLIEPCGSKLRLPSITLENDDMIDTKYELPPREQNDEEKIKEEPDKRTAHLGTTDELKWVLHDIITTT